jgi:hypothetical protein
MYEQEMARVVSLIERLDNMRIEGDAWSGNARSGFMFNPDSLPTDLGCGAGQGPPGAGGGACCFPDGSCQQLDYPTCRDDRGNYLGDGTQCGPNTCINGGGGGGGACCFGDGSCAFISYLDCYNEGGTFYGQGVECASAFCPQPEPPHQGACCASGVCYFTDPTTCQNIGGSYLGDNTDCFGIDCTQGACCYSEIQCLIQTPSQCATNGGVYLGDGSQCTGVRDQCLNAWCLQTPGNWLCLPNPPCVYNPPICGGGYCCCLGNSTNRDCCTSNDFGCACCYDPIGQLYYFCCCRHTPFGDQCGNPSSDVRLKTDIQLLGYADRTLPVVSFRFKGSPQRYVGTLAHLAELFYPDAVTTNLDGYKAINYSMIDVPFYAIR